MQSKDDLTYHLTSHLRLNAVYWGFTALYILDKPDALDREEMIEFVMSCWDEGAGKRKSFFIFNFAPSQRFLKLCKLLGAFGAHPDHDAHLLSTLSAIQILVVQDALDRMDVDRVVKCQYTHPLPHL